MEVYETKTTYDKNRKEFDHKKYRCRQDDVWGRLEIPKSLISEEHREDPAR
jgi:hypothetical protein